MHSYIFEVGDQPFCGDFIDADWVTEDDALFSFADCVSDIHSEQRMDAIELLKEITADIFDWHIEPGNPPGFEEVWFTVKSPEAVQQYFSARWREFRKKVQEMNLRDFVDDDQRYKLIDMVESRTGTYLRIDGGYYPLDRFIRKNAENTDRRFYVGGVLDYHC